MAQALRALLIAVIAFNLVCDLLLAYRGLAQGDVLPSVAGGLKNLALVGYGCGMLACVLWPRVVADSLQSLAEYFDD